MVPRIKELYEKKVLPELMKKYKLKNRFMVPILEKIVINVGVGEAKDNANLLKTVVDELKIITGQAPVITKAKKAISNFKIRKGVSILSEYRCAGKSNEHCILKNLSHCCS